MKAERTGLATANITWSAPASNDPAIEGYKIFYDGGSITVDNDTTSVTIPSDQLLPNETHDVFVVAYSNGDTLPSGPTNIVIPSGNNVGGTSSSIRHECHFVACIVLNLCQLNHTFSLSLSLSQL